MKKSLLLTCTFALSAVFLMAQEAGKIGELLPNEVQAEAIQTEKTTTDRKSTTDKNQKRGGNFGRGNNGRGHTQPIYTWDYNYNAGYAEVFIRIPEYGIFSVSLDDQTIATPSGRFRFFDVRPGNNLLQIYMNGRLMYRGRVNIRNNQRMILDYFTYEGLYLLQSVNLYNNGMSNYNYSDLWNHMWNGYYNGFQYNYGNNWNPYYGMNNSDNYYNNQNNNYYNNGYYNNGNYQNGQYGYYNNTMTTQEFGTFKNYVMQQSFDSNKVQMIKTQTQQKLFTASQIKELMGLFSFDENKLDVAKYCYDKCVDPENYYITYNALSFQDNRTKLMNYVSEFRK